jgi:hypothetical protein
MRKRKRRGPVRTDVKAMQLNAAGRAAYIAGNGINRNPYTRGGWYWKHWRRGWQEQSIYERLANTATPKKRVMVEKPATFSFGGYAIPMGPRPQKERLGVARRMATVLMDRYGFLELHIGSKVWNAMHADIANAIMRGVRRNA